MTRARKHRLHQAAEELADIVERVIRRMSNDGRTTAMRALKRITHKTKKRKEP